MDKNHSSASMELAAPFRVNANNYEYEYVNDMMGGFGQGMPFGQHPNMAQQSRMPPPGQEDDGEAGSRLLAGRPRWENGPAL